MANNDFLKELAKKPPKVKAAILAGIIIAFGAIYYQLFYSSLVEERDSLQSRKSSLTKKQTQLDKDLKEKRKLAEQNDELQRSIRDNQKALPSEAELPAFYDHLQRKAGDAGVNIRKWENLPEEPLDIYVRVPVKVVITGSFYSIKRYFSLLGPRSQDSTRDAVVSDPQNPEDPRIDERIVSIENLALSNSRLKDGSMALSATFTASTFRQKVDEKKKKEEEAKKKAAAAAKAKAEKNKKTKGPAGKATDKVNKATDKRDKAVDTKVKAGDKQPASKAGK